MTDPRPHVVVNLCWLDPGRVGGSEEYATRLVEAVAALPGVTSTGPRITVAGSAGLVAAHPELAPLTVEGPLSARRRPLRMGIESTWLAARTRGVDLVHHMGGRLPAVRGAPAALTIHDLQPLDLAANFSTVKARYLAWALPRSARAAVAVATPSRWVAAGVVERFGLDPDRVVPVPSSVDPRLVAGAGRDVDGGPDPAARRELAALVAPDEAVILYPAVTHPHKNHAVLLEAVAALARRRAPDGGGVRLVLTGGRGAAHEAVMAQVARLGGIALHRGRVAPAELARWYARADVVAFPSRYEGFGLPVLEAMAVGVPVVAADATALPEVAGDAAVLVDPDDPGSWVDALAASLDDGPDRRRRVAAGRRRAAEFTPEASARRLLAFWRSCLGT